jgi:hypothetical protein
LGGDHPPLSSSVLLVEQATTKRKQYQALVLTAASSTLTVGLQSNIDNTFYYVDDFKRILTQNRIMYLLRS